MAEADDTLCESYKECLLYTELASPRIALQEKGSALCASQWPPARPAFLVHRIERDSSKFSSNVRSRELKPNKALKDPLGRVHVCVVVFQ